MNRLCLNFGLASLIAAVLLMSGCAPRLAQETTEAPTPSAYRIGPGDNLRIYVRNNKDLSLTVPVRPDGKISIPLVESITAAGRTPTQLAGDLEQALSTYVRDPLVTVIVTNFVGTYGDQIRVVGEAAQPQAIPYRDGMTLLDVMIQVGGLTKFAAGNRAKLVRQLPDGESKTYGVNLQDLLDGNIRSNAAVRPGDVIIIPQTYF